MKKLFVILIIFFTCVNVNCQTKVNFNSFQAWRQNQATKKMEYLKTIYEKGYLEVNHSNSTVIVYNQKLNQKELLRFTSINKTQPSGHYLGFGKDNTQQMFSFIPEDKLILIKVNDIVIMQFEITTIDVQNLKKELN